MNSTYTRRGQPATIGLVDDHPLVRRGLASFLAEEGYLVTIQADNGQRLIEAMTGSEAPEIMIVDVNMPVMDGFATTEWLQQHHPHIRILALSVSDREETIARMLRSGASGYVLKDSHPQVLIRAIESIRKESAGAGE